MSQNPLPSDFHARGSVRAKLMRVVLLTTALALTVSGIAMLLHELYVYRTAWTADISTEAAIVALSAVPALTLDDRAAAERLVRGRYLLQDDADRLIAQAEASKVLK